MRAVKFLPLVLGLMALSACFVSDVPLLGKGDGVIFAGEPVAFCDSEESCETASVAGDTYVITPEADSGEQPVELRFAPLTGEGPGEVYLGQAELTDGADQTAWFYIVVRALPSLEDGTPAWQIVQPDCTEATDAQQAAYGIEMLDSYTCTIGSWEDLEAYLLEAHGEDLRDPAWWDGQF